MQPLQFLVSVAVLMPLFQFRLVIHLFSDFNLELELVAVPVPVNALFAVSSLVNLKFIYNDYDYDDLKLMCIHLSCYVPERKLGIYFHTKCVMLYKTIRIYNIFIAGMSKCRHTRLKMYWIRCISQVWNITYVYIRENVLKLYWSVR